MSKEINTNNPFVIQEGRYQVGHLNDGYRLSWVEETFSRGGKRGEVIGRSFNFNILRWAAILLISMFAVLGFRLVYLQLFEGENFLKMAEGNRIRIERVEARRGIIYDAQKNPMVHNVANFILYLTPSDLPKDSGERSAVIRRVANILYPISPHQNLLNKSSADLASSSMEEVYTMIDEGLGKIKPRSLEAFQPFFIADDISYEKAVQLQLEFADWKAVVVVTKTRRNYLLPAHSLSHILGYTSKINQTELNEAGDEYQPIDYIGKNGLEYFYEGELRGVNGRKQIEVDALGRVKKIVSSGDATDGADLVLSLDLAAQKKLEELLQKQLTEMGLKRGSAVVLNPQTGGILALVSLPAYDDNVFARGITKAEYKLLLDDKDRPLFNRAVNGEFPAGSTIKPVMAAASLNEGIVTENTTFLSNGGLRVGQWVFPDWKSGGHGVTDVKKALAESVNTFFYIIGGGYNDFTGLGVDRIVRYLKMFGMGEQTGLDLPGEADGFVPTKEWKEVAKGERWYVGDTYHLVIGQGDLTSTPLQIAQTTAYFANSGKMMQPHLVAKIIRADGTVEDKEQIVIKENLVSSEATDIVRRGMRQTVVAGSARSINAAVPVAVAGKTGTAQWSTKKAPHAWFTGFAPFDNPNIVITILVEEGKEGSVAATPVAREFLKWYYSPKVASSTASSTPIK